MVALGVNELDALLECSHRDRRIAHINVEAGGLLGQNLSVGRVNLYRVVCAAILDSCYARIDEDGSLVAFDLIDLDLRFVVDTNLRIVREDDLRAALRIRGIEQDTPV